MHLLLLLHPYLIARVLKFADCAAFRGGKLCTRFGNSSRERPTSTCADKPLRTAPPLPARVHVTSPARISSTSDAHVFAFDSVPNTISAVSVCSTVRRKRNHDVSGTRRASFAGTSPRSRITAPKPPLSSSRSAAFSACSNAERSASLRECVAPISEDLTALGWSTALANSRTMLPSRLSVP